MDLRLPAKLRAALYAISALGTPVVAYLNEREIIGAPEVTLWSALAAVIGGMAAFKAISPDTPETGAALHALGHEDPGEPDGP